MNIACDAYHFFFSCSIFFFWIEVILNLFQTDYYSQPLLIAVQHNILQILFNCEPTKKKKLVHQMQSNDNFRVFQSMWKLNWMGEIGGVNEEQPYRMCNAFLWEYFSFCIDYNVHFYSQCESQCVVVHDVFRVRTITFTIPNEMVFFRLKCIAIFNVKSNALLVSLFLRMNACAQNGQIEVLYTLVLWDTDNFLSILLYVTMKWSVHMLHTNAFYIGYYYQANDSKDINWTG